MWWVCSASLPLIRIGLTYLPKIGDVRPPQSDGPASEVFIRSRAGAAASSLASITASDDSFFVNLLAFSLIRVFLQDAPPISLHK